MEVRATALVETQLASVTFGTQGGYVKVLFTMQASTVPGYNGTQFPYASLAVYKLNADGSKTRLNWYGNLYMPNFGSGGLASISINAIDTSPPPTGSYYVTVTSNTQGVDVACDGITLIAENSKV